MSSAAVCCTYLIDVNNAGLGEMMPLQLWETTLNPETRLLKQLRVEDVGETNVVFSSLMGSRVSGSLSLFILCLLSYS